MIRMAWLCALVLAGLASCQTSTKDKDYSTPLMRDHFLTAQTPLDAKLANWALESFRAETPTLVSIQLVPDQRMRILGHDGADSMAQGYLRFVLDRAGGDGQSGWQRNVYIPCYRNEDGSYRVARFRDPGIGTGTAEAGPWVTASYSCMGVNCAACEIRNIPWKTMHCGCTRVGDITAGPSYCNMSITVGLGAVIDNLTASIAADYSYVP
jgi:hypothetical protein